MATHLAARPQSFGGTDASDLLEMSPKAHLNAVCTITASLLKVPLAFVTVCDETHFWIKASYGADASRILREDAFCSDTIEVAPGGALVLADLRQDVRYRDSALVVGEPHARFYAGVPLSLGAGKQNIGTLCVIDRVPRHDFGAAQMRQLKDLASIVEAHLLLYKAGVDHERDQLRYRVLAEHTTDIIVWADLDSTRRYVSPAAKQVLGYDPAALVGTRPRDFVHPEDDAALAKVLDDLLHERVEQAVLCQRYGHRDGRWIWVEASFSLVRPREGGRATGYVASVRDVSDRKKIEDALRVSEERLAFALDGGCDGMWDWDLATGAMRSSGRWASMLGYAPDAIAPHITAWQALVHPDDAPRAAQRLIDHLKGATARLECEYRVRASSGDYLWTLARGKVVSRNAQGRATRIVGTHIDITARKDAEWQLKHLAKHDALTGLPNRIAFRDRLNQEVERARHSSYTFAVLACDLDRFKTVNDTYGHPVGDSLLRIISKRLKPVLRDEDMVARLGGDEFAIVLGQLDHSRDAGFAARRVIEAIECPLEIDGHRLCVGASVGIAMGPIDGADADLLFKNADIALYQAKAAGRNIHRFYEAGMDARVAEENLLEQDLREAIRNGGLSLDYQPIVQLDSGAISGFEALLRWDHPIRGAVPPTRFIPIAEQTGLIVVLGEWALRKACEEASSWPNDLRVAVNVSAVQFQQPGLEQSVLIALSATGLAAHRLELEITESVLISDPEPVIACLQRLRALGVRIALDDFGTGYSSLSYLRRFPFSKIKIDGSFVRNIDDPDTAAIVRAVVGLAARAGAAITAEGVETSEQLMRVRAEGCTEVQGYLFSPPLRAEEARRIVTLASAVAA